MACQNLLLDFLKTFPNATGLFIDLSENAKSSLVIYLISYISIRVIQICEIQETYVQKHCSTFLHLCLPQKTKITYDVISWKKLDVFTNNIFVSVISIKFVLRFAYVLGRKARRQEGAGRSRS